MGVFGADISLDWLYGKLRAIDKEYSFFKGFVKNTKNIDTLSIFSSSIIIDSVGTFIVHPDKKRILVDNFYEELRQQKDTASLQLLKDMKAGKSGTGKAMIDRLTHYVFYAPHEQTGWMMAIIVPKLIIMLPIVMRCFVLSFIFFLTLIAVYIICRSTIRRTGRLRYCNAGHKAPVLIPQFSCLMPQQRNLPVGAMPDWTFSQQETMVAPGTTLFLYTDGLDEAENAQGQMFGKERIQEVLQATSPEPRTLITEITEAVAHFVGDTEQSDDLTMLALQYV